MRIVVHDFAGHPFQVQLSRELARRGNEVLHLHCPSYISGKGAVEKGRDDPAALVIRGLSLGRPFDKYSARKRLVQELQYARSLVAEARRFRPDIVISSNTPLLAQRALLSRCHGLDAKFIFWQQDIYSYAAGPIAAKRLGPVGRVIGRAFGTLERRLLRRSDAVVVISEDFVPALTGWGVGREKIHVIHNWAPLHELPARSRDNAWAREHALVGKRVVLYTGTLGMKHDPGLLLALAVEFRRDPDVRVVVVSEGEGADWLRTRALEVELANLDVLPFQPYERLSDVLATGDVLVVILEADAAAFSVPSKMLSYLCAGRPIVAAVPGANLAARTIARARAGVVVEPSNTSEFVRAARLVLTEDGLREEMGAHAREYAERTFDIQTIGSRFEAVIDEIATVDEGRIASGVPARE